MEERVRDRTYWSELPTLNRMGWLNSSHQKMKKKYKTDDHWGKSCTSAELVVFRRIQIPSMGNVTVSWHISHGDVLVSSAEYIKCKCITREMNVYYVILMGMLWHLHFHKCIYLHALNYKE
jgi:hypothetical protein